MSTQQHQRRRRREVSVYAPSEDVYDYHGASTRSRRDYATIAPVRSMTYPQIPVSLPGHVHENTPRSSPYRRQRAQTIDVGATPRLCSWDFQVSAFEDDKLECDKEKFGEKFRRTVNGFLHGKKDTERQQCVTVKDKKLLRNSPSSPLLSQFSLQSSRLRHQYSPTNSHSDQHYTSRYENALPLELQDAVRNQSSSHWASALPSESRKPWVPPEIEYEAPRPAPRPPTSSRVLRGAKSVGGYQSQLREMFTVRDSSEVGLNQGQVDRDQVLMSEAKAFLLAEY